MSVIWHYLYQQFRISDSVLSLNSYLYLLLNEPFHILSLTNLFQHVPDIIVVVYIDLLLKVGHVILEPGAFISRLVIRLKISSDTMEEKNKSDIPQGQRFRFQARSP